MAEIVICTVFFTLIFVFDFIPVVKSKKKVPIWIFAVCMLVTYVVQVLYSLGIPVFSPAVPIQMAIIAIFHLQ